MSATQHLIFSDLDGTLLDHYTYRSSAASETLEQLHDANIPVILNTSKTFAELAIILDQLKLKTPFIIENGAAVYIPIGTFEKQPEDTDVIGDYWVKSFCLPRDHWLDLLSEQTTQYALDYQGFSTLSDKALSQLTGLTLDDAIRAKQRQYGEPIHWFGDEEAKKVFVEHLVTLGANVVQGGRFIHVGGHCDKGQAMIWLTEQYRELCKDKTVLTIALGDGENDISMLEASDIAVQIRSPVHEFPTLYRQYHTTQTQLYGPEGWAEAIQQLLSTSINSEVNHG